MRPPTPTMRPPTPTLLLATTDPAAATDSFNLLEDGFAAFLRNSRPRQNTSLSPRFSYYNPSSRLPSALPPSASPRMVEPLTPDRAQPVLPFYSEHDTADLQPSRCFTRQPVQSKETQAEIQRRIEWARSQPPLPRITSEVGVVDEDAADRMFKMAKRGPRNSNNPFAPQKEEPVLLHQQAPHPAMKLELAPLRNPSGALSHANNGPPELSPSAWGLVSGGSMSVGLNLPSGKEERGWGRDILGSFAGQKRGAVDSQREMCVERRISTAPAVNYGGGGSSSSVSEEGKDDVIIRGGGGKKKGRRGGKICNGVDPLKCHLCGQRFARRSNLFKHLRSVHEEVRRFACTACSFKFKRQDHLLKHTRSVHNKVRKFQCGICGIGFAEKFNRDKHTKSIHFTKRPFQCPCGAYFQDQDKMMACLRCTAAATLSTV